MEETPKNHENGGQEIGADILSDMPSFEKHMAEGAAESAEKLDPFWDEHPDLLAEAKEFGAPLTVKEFKEEGYVFGTDEDGSRHVLAMTPGYKKWLEADEKDRAPIYGGRKYESLDDKARRKEFEEKQREAKEYLARWGLEDIDSREAPWSLEAIYDVRKRDIIEKVFVGDNDDMMHIKNPANMSEVERKKTKSALEDMIEFGTFTLLESDGDNGSVYVPNHLFARYLDEACNSVVSKPLYPGRIELLEDWGQKETPEDLLKLFDKYNIDVKDEKIREKALNGFVRTITYGHMQYSVGEPRGWDLYTTPMQTSIPADQVHGSATNQADWYYKTFELGTLQKTIGKEKMDECVKKYRSQFPKATIVPERETYGNLEHVNAFDYCLEQFKELHNIEGNPFDQE